MTGVLTALSFSKRLIDSELVQANTEREIIEISSDEESKDEEKRENNQSPRKKRALSNSATGSPSKRRVTLRLEPVDTGHTAIEVLDSDDEHPTAIPTKSATGPIKVESGANSEMTASSINDAAKDKGGRYIVTQKVKVDSIKNLLEVPARWPITPEGTNTAYIFDLKNDKKWQKLDPNSKKKYLDCFIIKQEVCPNLNIFMSLKLSKPYIILGSGFMGEGDQRFDQSSNPHPVP